MASFTPQVFFAHFLEVPGTLLDAEDTQRQGRHAARLPEAYERVGGAAEGWTQIHK